MPGKMLLPFWSSGEPLHVVLFQEARNKLSPSEMSVNQPWGDSLAYGGETTEAKNYLGFSKGDEIYIMMVPKSQRVLLVFLGPVEKWQQC